jgi:cell division protein FtsB
MKFRTILLGLAALFVAFNAAYFSVTGLSKLFAGATTSVIIMASSLEVAKLIGASFLYNYWTSINKLLRTYLTIAVFVLVLITSAGIYGYLTSAYQTTADQLSITDKQTEIIELKKTRYKEELATYTVEKTQLNTTINDLSKGLSNNVIQYTNKAGQLITTTSSSTRKVLSAELSDSKLQRDKITQKIDVLNDSITSFDIQILNLRVNNEVAAEIGPLRYLSNLTGWEMGKVVNWFALFIIFVFDPLAVTLIVAFNTAIKVDKGEKDKKKVIEHRILYGEEPLKEDDEIAMQDMDKLDDPLEPWHDSPIVSPGITTREPNTEIFPKSIEEIKEDVNNDAGGWKNAYHGLPYYLNPDFDWSKPERWVNDKVATKYWLDYKGGTHSLLQKYRSEFSDNTTTRTY